MYASVGRPSNRAGEVVAGAVAADALPHPQRALADGGDGLQPVVPLVRGAERGRRGVGREGVQQEPRPPAGGGCSQAVLGAGGGAGAGPGSDLGRALHGGRDAAGSLGGGEKFSAEGKENSAARR